MALFFTVLLGLGVFVLGYFNYYFNRGHYVTGAEKLINAEIEHLTALWPVAGGEQILSGLIESPPNTQTKIYAYMNPQGQILLGNIETVPAHVSRLAEGVITFQVEQGTLPGAGNKPGLYASKIHTFPNGNKLLIALHIEDIARQYQFMQLLSVVTIFIMVVVIATSFAISTFVVSRTNRIAATAKNIMSTGDLSRRITTDSNWDDLSFLALVLNELLEKIETLIGNVRQVSDNIAHDLRTPLTRMRNRLESLATQAEQEHSSDISQKAVGLIDEADHLLSTFNALLRISNIESGKNKALFESSNLQTLLTDVIELYEAVAEDKAITINHNMTDIPYRCDHNLLFQAFANVLDNAIKFTPSGGHVDVVLSTCIKNGESVIEIQIADSGPGLQSQDKGRIFDRFYREDQSRHSPGSGLGLSLVQAIILLHNGEISLEDNKPGLKMVIHLPQQT
jgi:signal transduction histidine kinase